MLRDSAAGPEIFMVRRHGESGAFKGAHVFPGGRVDRHDGDEVNSDWCDGVESAERQLSDVGAIEAVAYHVAAARELFEEAGVLLARDSTGRFVSLAGATDHRRFAGHRRLVHAHERTFRDVLGGERLRLAFDALIRYAHWVTPPVEDRRFDTRFFVTRVPPNQAPVHDEAETTASAWMTARDALDSAERREIVLPPPTWITLRELLPFQSVDEVLAWAAGRDIRRREPRLVQDNGARMLVMPDDTRFVWTDGHWRPQRPAASTTRIE
jgi:8-oxo-dGTP pyrophosphatase MutT (NUDIX family)